jgi:hypothetical protein
MGDTNFIPAARWLRKRRRRRLVLWSVVCLLYGGLLTGGSVARCLFSPGAERRVADELTEASRQLKADTAVLAEIRRQLDEAEAVIQTARAMQQQPDWSKLLLGLSEQLGRRIVLGRCSLVAFHEDDASLADGGASAISSKSLGGLLTERRYKLRLKGSGKSQEDVTQFVLRLEAAGLFERVHLASSSRQTFLDGQAVAFVIDCRF